MGHLRIKSDKCGFKEKDRRLKEQFINGINDDMMTKIMWELTTIKKDRWSYHGAGISMGQESWGRKSQGSADRGKKKESKEFHAIKMQELKYSSFYRTKAGKRETLNNWRYCRSTHEPWRCPALGKSCSRCGKLNQFKLVCMGQSR